MLDFLSVNVMQLLNAASVGLLLLISVKCMLLESYQTALHTF